MPAAKDDKQPSFRPCGCDEDATSAPTLLSASFTATAIRRHLVHACGKSWRQVEIREDGETDDDHE